jgi:leader peptidase (prepilin peptidase)/N-methyltransferase
MNASLISEALLFALGLGTGLLVGVIVNLLGRAIPLEMEAEWRRHVTRLSHTDVVVRPTMLKVASDALYVECQCCLHPTPLANFSPLLELLLRDGRCPSCDERTVPAKFALPELICIAASIAILFRYGPSVGAAAGIFYSGCLVLLALTSVRQQLMPNMVTYTLLWAGLGINIEATFVPLDQAVLGAAAGYVLPWSIYWLVKLASGRKILGYGNFKAMAAIGAWVGLDMAIAACLMALLLKAVDWFPYRTEGAEVGSFCPLGVQLAGVGIAAFAFL